MLTRRSLLCLGLGLGVLAGCGGGGGSDNLSGTLQIAQLAVRWPERSRSAAAPVSALSFVLTIKAATQGGSGPNGTGTPVASTSLLTTISSVDGTIAETITVAATLKKIELATGQRLWVGEEAYVLYTARDANNSIVALPEGSGFLEVTSGNSSLSAVGETLKGLAGGTAKVRIRGKTSFPTMPLWPRFPGSVLRSYMSVRRSRPTTSRPVFPSRFPSALRRGSWPTMWRRAFGPTSFWMSSLEPL
jgi:hypothetical protein